MISTVGSQVGVPVDGADRFVRRGDVDVHELDGEAVLYDLVLNTTCRLNGTAYFVWQCCDGKMSVDDICAAILSRFDVGGAVARRDVRMAVSAFWESGLVERMDDGVVA